eukprot:4141438-Amphidinium_carterae.1
MQRHSAPVYVFVEYARLAEEHLNTHMCLLSMAAGTPLHVNFFNLATELKPVADVFFGGIPRDTLHNHLLVAKYWEVDLT